MNLSEGHTMPKNKRKPGGGDSSRNIRARTEPTQESMHEVMHADLSQQSNVDSNSNKDCVSCNTHFTSVEAYRYHRDTKLLNKTARFVPLSKVRKNRHLLLCPTLMCCYNTKKMKNLKDHMRTVHHKPHPPSALVITNLPEAEIRVTSNQCGICCKNFSSSKGLSNHMATCRGKYLYPCVYCKNTFLSRDEYTEHLMKTHKPQTDFRETAVFIGDSSSKTKTDKKLQPISTERSLVYLNSNVTTEDQIFNPNVVSALRSLLQYDVAMGKRISVRLLCRALIQKFEGDQIITKPFYCQTMQVTIGNDVEIDSFIKFASAKILQHLSLLFATPSGFRLLEVSSLTLSSTICPDLRGGCGKYLHEMHKTAERRGLFSIMNDDKDNKNEHVTCFRDAVMFSVYGKDIMSELIDMRREYCNSKMHSISCKCYKEAEEEFKKKARKSTFWDAVYSQSNLNFEGINYPAGLEDVARFSEQNPQIHIRESLCHLDRICTKVREAHLIHGSSAVNVFVGERNIQQKHNIDLCFSEFLNYSNHEIVGHWYPVSNIAEFCRKVCRKKVEDEDSAETDRIAKRYNVDTCPGCLKQHFLPKEAPAKGINASSKDVGIFRYRDVYCPYELPSKMALSTIHRRHIDLCGGAPEYLQKASESPTQIHTGIKKYFLFSKYEATVEHRFTGYFDLETFNTELHPTCIECSELMELTQDKKRRDEIYKVCQDEHNFKLREGKCQDCKSKLRQKISEHNCTHVDADYRFMNCCYRCFRKIEKSFGSCNHSKSSNVRELEASGYSFILVDNYSRQIVFEQSYFQCSPDDDNPVKHFMSLLREEMVPFLSDKIRPNVPMKITDQEEKLFKAASSCYCCHKPFRDMQGTDNKVRDHCHVLGNFRGACCKICNRKLTLQQTVNIMVHNLTGFDGHLVLRELEGWDAYHIIPKNSEKVTGITLSKRIKATPTAAELYESKAENGKQDSTLSFIFKDTLTFLGGSLDRSTQKLCESHHGFPFLKQSDLCKTDGIFDEKKFELLLRKGSYPYDAIQNFDDLMMKEFPPREKFYSCLGVGREISEKDWRHGKEVWETFQCKSMLDYSKIYVELDTLLLLENFRTICDYASERFGIHANHFYTLPSLAMTCCIKLLHDDRKDKNVKLLEDWSMIKFIAQAKRGGLTSTLGPRLVYSREGAKDVKRSLRTLNGLNPRTLQSLEDAVDEAIKSELKEDEDFAILYLDANNLYGFAQTQMLPHSKFKWADEKDIEILNRFFKTRSDPELENLEWSQLWEDKWGFFIEADISFPEHVKKDLANFPPAPHRVQCKFGALSEFARNLIEETGINYVEGEKLCVTLCDKKSYITHHKLFDLYSEIGAVVSNVTRAIKFEQRPFLKKWVDINTEGRMKAAAIGNEVQKAFYKLQVNATFGKFGENLIEQTDMKIITNRNDFNREILDPFYKGHKILSENLVVVEKYKECVQLDRPIQIASAILEIAKHEMYRFFYKVIRPAFGDRAQLCYTDTDSFVIRLKTKNLDADYRLIEKSLDTSNFPKDHPLYRPDRASQLGYFKSETGGNAISVFSSLRAKCYTLLLEERKASGDIKKITENKLKGVNRDAVALMDLSHYLRTLLMNDVQYATSTRICSKSHNIFIQRNVKKSLANLDDKIRIKNCGIHTTKYGEKANDDDCDCSFSKCIKYA